MAVSRFVLAQSVGGTTQVAAGSAGNRHKVIGIVISLANDGTWKFTGSADLTGAIKQDGQLQPVVIGPYAIPLVETEVGAALNIVTTQAAQGVILYVTEL